MPPRYKVGQKVVIVPARSGQAPARDAGLDDYTGRTGVVENYHWISPPGVGKEVFLYTVHIEKSDKDLVLYDDELRPV
jgi:ribosomal protein L21E